MLNIVPSNVGPRLATSRGIAVHSTRDPGSQTFVAPAHCFAVMLSPSPRISTAFGSDKVTSFDALTGMIAVSPAHVDSRTTWPFHRENIVVAMEPQNMLELAQQEFDVGDFELAPVCRKIDPIALHMARLLKGELAREEPSELYVDSLITLFGLHVLRNYSSIAKPQARVTGGLSALAARKVQEYMDEHFARKLAVAELAAVGQLSPGYFIQAFTRTFGVPPHRYILNKRLGFAEELLRETEMTIADVAEVSGFSSQSHLTASMRKFRQMTPAQARMGR